MLVLSRKRDEQIVLISDGIEVGNVTVVDIRGDKVRLGINMPNECTIHRREVWAAIQAEKQGA